MYYHSPQFQNIADQAAAFARPLILQTIRELATDFAQKYPDVLRLDCSTGRIEGHRANGIVKNAEWIEMSKNTPLMFFLLDTIHKYTIGFCPDITLQPVLMIDGVPIEEAIDNARISIYIIVKELGEPEKEIIAVSTNRETAKHISEKGDFGKVEEWPNAI